MRQPASLAALRLLISCFILVFAVPVSAQESGTQKKSQPAKAKQAQRKNTGANGSLDARERLVKRTVTDKNGRTKVVYQRVAARPIVPAVPPVLTAADLAGLNLTRDPLALASNVALVVDQSNSQILFEKNAHVALPIASITKLMTGLIVVEAKQDMDEILEITDEDIDREKGTGSRLKIGARLSRGNLLHIALMSSENRAASALGRNYPGGRMAFVMAMNEKARALGMEDTHYVDSTGLSSRNVASARDLAKLVIAAYEQPLLCEYSTDGNYVVNASGRPLQYGNTNHLVKSPQWDIGIQKTGYISEAGRCLVMQVRIDGRPVVMIFLDSKGKMGRTNDPGRIRKWLETNKDNDSPTRITTT